VQYPHDKIDCGKNYYAITYSANARGDIYVGSYTIWTGFADEERKNELRKPDFIKADVSARVHKRLGIPFCVVNSLTDFAKWFLTGGLAFVESKTAEAVLPELMKPSPCVRLGEFGFTSTALLPRAIFHRAPTPRKRMEVIKRDKYKCKICGRRPVDYVDIELHVHHIRPHAQRGLTHEDNLITLCQTCHAGLEPHYEWSLYKLLTPDQDEDFAKRSRREYLEGVRNYRVALRSILTVPKFSGHQAGADSPY
jgi:hypothetical protein